ncbi:TetR family transcriptional regulator [Streptomyces sp. NPDC021140]|uniref:TetR family transcriptional regulator n=1 Tax=Streptomyces sp. NPDC021140 TaxID=3365116 RepID=UPI0037B055DD
MQPPGCEGSVQQQATGPRDQTATRGFACLPLCAVAAELGATTGLLTHYFPTKRALLEHAHGLLEQRTLSHPAAVRAGARPPSGTPRSPTPPWPPTTPASTPRAARGCGNG